MPLIVNPYSGQQNIMTACVYRLDSATSTVPVEPLLDIVPGLTGNRIPIDLVENESWQDTYEVTTHAVQDFVDIQNNIHINPRALSFSGILTGILQTPAGPLFGGGTPPGYRSDLAKLTNLRALGRARKPVMVITPRGTLRCVITSIEAPWDIELSENSRVSISFLEIQVVSPLTGAINPDFAAQTTGNNSSQGGGQQVGQTQTQQFGFQTNPLAGPSIV